MKKIIAYTDDQVKQIVGLLNCVTVTGIQNSKQIAAVAQILDSGMPGEVGEPVVATGTCNTQNSAMPVKEMR